MRMGRKTEIHDTKELHAQIEQTIAETVLKRHNRLLENGCIDGVSVGLKLVDEVSGGRGGVSYRTNYNGKVQVRVGDQAHWVTGQAGVGFKQLKDGGHNYDKIADKMVEMADYKTRVEAHKAKKRSKYEENRTFIKELEEELELYSAGSDLTANLQTGNLSFKVSSLTQEQAEAFVLLGMTLGVIKEKPKG